MISLPFRRQSRTPIFAKLYGTIVAQARSLSFYADYGVPDTIAGRLDMIVLHLFLVLARIKGESAEVQAIGQEVFNEFCRDIDDNLREMTIGDLAVPKKMRQVGEIFYGRSLAYENGLREGRAALIDALSRNIFGESAPGATRLASYVSEAVRVLAAQQKLGDGELVFPDPALIAQDGLVRGELA